MENLFFILTIVAYAGSLSCYLRFLSAGKEIAGRLAAEDVTPVAGGHSIRRVRLPALELLDFEFAAERVDMAMDVRAERRRVERVNGRDELRPWIGSRAHLSREGPPRPTDPLPGGQRAERAWGDVSS